MKPSFQPQSGSCKTCNGASTVDKDTGLCRVCREKWAKELGAMKDFAIDRVAELAGVAPRRTRGRR